MNDRRKFFATIFSAGSAWLLGRAQARDEKAAAGRAAPQPEQGFTFEKTILCQITDAALLSHIYWEAERLSCRIACAEPGSWDIVATPCFVQILDRNTIGDKQWAEYLDIRREIAEGPDELYNQPDYCLLVDRLGTEGAWALDDRMEVIDPGSPEGMQRLFARLAVEREKAADRAKRMRRLVEEARRNA